MARTVKEWIGRTDNSPPSDSCKLRVLDRQGNCCAITGQEFRPGDKIEFDHISPLWLGGENREKNLQAVMSAPHKRKTATEAAVRSKVKDSKLKHLSLKSKPSRGLSKPAGMKYNWKVGRYERV